MIRRILVAAGLVVVSLGGGGTAVARRSAGLASTADGTSRSALATCPPSQPITSLSAFVRTGAAQTPDDVTVDPSGDVWVTVESQGHVLDFSGAGALKQDLPDPYGPEGIIVTARGTVVADQFQSRVDRIEAGGRLVPFLKLSNNHQRLPVDGLGFDARRQRLLVPNSPEGTLLMTPLVAATPRLLARGLGRPVAAAVGADGAIYVAAESNAGLLRVPANGGSSKRVGALSNLDEVVSVGNLLYTAGAGDGTVQAVDPSTGLSKILVTGGQQLQGLAALPDGRLLLIDSSTHTIAFAPTCP